MKSKSLIISVILYSLIFFSCNFYKIRENQVVSKFEKSGLVSRFYKSNKTTIHYWSGGKGQSLILLHGFGADSRFQWYDQVPVLADKFHLIIPDLIYFDGSRSSSNNFSVDFQASKIIDLISSQNIQKFSMIGVSYGGLVSITICDKMPERIDKLVISDSPIKFYTAKHKNEALKIFNAATIQELLIPKNPKGVPRLLGLAYHKPPWVPSMVLKNIHENMFLNQADGKGKLLEYLITNEIAMNKKDYRVNCDTLLIWGRHDLLIPVEIGTKLKEYLKGRARLEVIEDTAHMPNLEKPKIFNKLILEFLI